MAPHRPVTDEEDDDDEEESVVTATTTTDQSFDHHRHQNHHHREEQQQQKMVIEGRMQQRLLSSAEEEEEEDARNDDDEERKSEDDELTSLSWLQNRNLLQTCISGNDQSNGVGTFTSSVHGSSSLSESVSSTNGRETQLSPSLRSNGLTTTTAEGGVQRGSSSSLPSVVSLEFYNPTVHVCTKPPYSFSCLIFMAIEDSPNCALPVKDIYSWILSRFPYFQNAPTGWKNSVRHNLSLNKCFLKVDKGQNIAKGSLWCVDPEYRPNLIQALRKTPYNPYHHIQLPSGPRIASKLSSQNPIIVAGNGCTTNLPNPDLFPFLSKRLAASAMKDPEVDAAATMLALKNGPHVLDNSGLKDFSRVHGSRNSRVISPIKERRERRIHEKLKVKIGRSLKPQALSVCVPVITVSPTEDHTYSSTNSPTRHTTSDSPSSSIDEPFEFGGGSGGGVLAGQLSPRNRALLLTGHNGDGDSGGDSGVTRSATSESDEEYTSVVREFAEVIKEESSSYEMTPRVTPVRCPVIVRTVTTTSGHCKVVMDDEEQQKIVDGADALLNLAGIRTHANEASVIRKRSKARRKRKLSRRHLRHLVPVDEAHR